MTPRGWCSCWKSHAARRGIPWVLTPKPWNPPEFFVFRHKQGPLCLPERGVASLQCSSRGSGFSCEKPFTTSLVVPTAVFGHSSWQSLHARAPGYWVRLATPLQGGNLSGSVIAWASPLKPSVSLVHTDTRSIASVSLNRDQCAWNCVSCWVPW